MGHLIVLCFERGEKSRRPEFVEELATLGAFPLNDGCWQLGPEADITAVEQAFKRLRQANDRIGIYRVVDPA